MKTLTEAARRCLDCAVPEDKVALTRETFAALRAGALSLADEGPEPAPIGVAGRRFGIRMAT